MRERNLVFARLGWVVLITIFWGSILALVAADRLPTAAATLQACVPGPHAGTITGTQTWCLADSPHTLASDVIVPTGVTLTVEPGVTVRGVNGKALLVEGYLEALGTAAQSITFTSAADTGSGEWAGVAFNGGSGRLRHATICYAGDANAVSTSVFNLGYYRSALTVQEGTVHLDHITLRDVATGDYDHGLLIDDGTIVMTDTLVTGIGNGGNLDAAMRVNGPETVLNMTGCTFIGNTRDRVLLMPDAMMGHDATLSAQPVLEGYELPDNFTVPPTFTLTVEPGVTLMGAYGKALFIEGELEALGTETQSITFTSALDSGSGQWGGIAIDGGSGQLRHTTVRYAGNRNDVTDALVGPHDHSNLVVRNGTLRLEDATVRDIATGDYDYGLVASDSHLIISDTLFTAIGNGDSKDVAMRLQGPDTVLEMSGCTFTGNTGDRVWLEPGAMMGHDATLAAQPALEGYEFREDYTVPPTFTLTLAPGVTLMGADHKALLVEGSLVAEGTAASPITFTSSLDTGGSQWGGIGFDAGSTGSMRYTTVRYAGRRNTVSDAFVPGNPYYVSAVTIIGGELHLEDVTLRDVTGDYDHGLLIDDSTVVMTDTLITGIGNDGQRDTPILVKGPDTVLTMKGCRFSGNTVDQVWLQPGAMTAHDISLSAQPVLDSYTLTDDFTVPSTVTLTVAPGVTVRGGTAGGSAELLVLGHLEATGTPTQPITFTSYADSGPRQWRGLVFNGTTGLGTGILRYATVRYGGRDNSVLDGSFSGYHEGANVTVYNVQAGEVSLEHVTLASTGNSYGDHGLYVNNGHTSVVSTTISNNCDGGNHDSGVYVAGQSSVLVDDSVIETNNAAGIVVEGDDAFVSVKNSRVVGNEGDGVRNTGEATVILSGDPAQGNVIAYNRDFAANQAGLTGQILAAHNYWGDPTGPTHAGNPGGLGAPVTDRVLYDPWLTEVPVGTPPASGVVLTYGPSVVSAGDTVNLGFLVPNVTSEVFRDAVLVVQLPEEAEFVQSWPAGAYWPDRHQVVWKLGDLAPGEEAAFGAQVRYLWGLQPHQMTYLTGLLVAENLPNDLLDLDEYLAYEALTVTSFDDLHEQELTALLAAEPDLKALFDDAERQGFSYYGAARLERLSDGTEQVSLPMLNRTSLGEWIFVRHVLSGAYRVHHLPSSAIVDTPVASFSYEYQTKWVEMLRSSLSQSALIFAAGRTACVGSGCDNFSFFDCLRNCLIANVPAHQFSPSYSQACFECYKAGGDACNTCAAHMEDYRNDSLQRSTQRCQDHCSNDSNWGKCDNDTPARECKTSGIVMVTPCDDCRFQPEEMTYESCHAGERCILGVCTPIKPPRTHRIEVLVAGDPNAMEGPMEAAPGQVVSYTIAYENVGEGTAYGVFIEAELPDQFDPASLVVHDGGMTFAESQTLLWSVGTLPASGGGEVSFEVQVPTETVSGTAIIANATVYFPSVPETTPTNDVVTRVGDVVAHSQNVVTDEGVPVPISLTGYTPTGDALQFEVVSEPLNGTLSGSLPNLTYTPATGFEGPDRLSFRVADTLNTSLPAEVAIKVNTGAEAVAPEVLFTVPGDGATDVRVYTTLLMVDTYHPMIWAQFTEPIDPTTVTAASFTVVDSEGQFLSGTIEYDGTANVARFVPSEPLVEGQTYIATLTTAVRDTSGNPLAADYVWRFRTQAQWIYLPMVVRGN